MTAPVAFVIMVLVAFWGHSNLTAPFVLVLVIFSLLCCRNAQCRKGQCQCYLVVIFLAKRKCYSVKLRCRGRCMIESNVLVARDLRSYLGTRKENGVLLDYSRHPIGDLLTQNG
jgi:hypothetical protein